LLYIATGQSTATKENLLGQYAFNGKVLRHRDKHIMSPFLKRRFNRMHWDVNKQVTG
jgi:hypothetical protein